MSVIIGATSALAAPIATGKARGTCNNSKTSPTKTAALRFFDDQQQQKQGVVTMAKKTTTAAAAAAAAAVATTTAMAWAPQATAATTAAAAVFEVSEDVFASSGLGPVLCTLGTVFIGYSVFSGYGTIKRLKEELTAEGYDVEEFSRVGELKVGPGGG